MIVNIMANLNVSSRVQSILSTCFKKSLEYFRHCVYEGTSSFSTYGIADPLIRSVACQL